MVANLHLRDRPREDGLPLAWDNVPYESPSLGYVAATHQRGLDYGPTIFTYYYPFCETDVRAARQRLLSLDWPEWSEVVLADLGRAHDDLAGLVERLDVIRWGHAMIRPRPGFVWSADRRKAAQPMRGIHFRPLRPERRCLVRGGVLSWRARRRGSPPRARCGLSIAVVTNFWCAKVELARRAR